MKDPAWLARGFGERSHGGLYQRCVFRKKMLAEMGRIFRKRLKIQARDDEGMKQGCEMVNRGGIPDTEVTKVGNGTQERGRGNRAEETDLCQTPLGVL